MMRPLGMPPTPRAMSRLRLPVGMDSTLSRVASPSFMIAPSPKRLFKLDRVVANAFSRETRGGWRADLLLDEAMGEGEVDFLLLRWQNLNRGLTKNRKTNWSEKANPNIQDIDSKEGCFLGELTNSCYNAPVGQYGTSVRIRCLFQSFVTLCRRTLHRPSLCCWLRTAADFPRC